MCTVVIYFVFKTCCSTSDIDECSHTEPPCDSHAICTDTSGSFICQCVQGFSGNGTICEGGVYFVIPTSLATYVFTSSFCPCIDVDECSGTGLNMCSVENGTCVNTVGSYTCHCNSGYTGDGYMCTGTYNYVDQ